MIYSNQNTIERTALLKTTGFLALLVVIVFAVNGIVASGQTITKAQSAEKPGIRDFMSEKTTVSNPPLLATSALAVNTTADDTGDTTPREDLDGLMSQINEDNSAIIVAMRQCVTISVEANAELKTLRARERQLKAEIDAVNQDMRDIDNDDPDRNAKRAELIEKRDDLNLERNQLIRETNERRADLNADKRVCQNNVSRLQSEKRRLESQLNSAYNKAMRANSF